MNLSDIKNWVFDLDNTLYSPEEDIFSQIDKRMTEFIISKFNVNEEEAFNIQKKYFLEYGTTLSGLMKRENIDPDEFLEFVHDINLEILKPNIEDELGNVTRFFIMGKETKHPEYKNKKYITSCIFKLKSIPAALYKALGGFATNGINLCKLESFSVKNTFDQVNFYIDIEGHIEDPSVQKSLEELGFHTQKLDILGVYEAHQFRFVSE